MEGGALGVDAAGAAAGDPAAAPDCSMACLRRRAWAQSRDSVWQETHPDHCSSQGPQQSQGDPVAAAAATQGATEEAGNVPNKITSWLIECSTPIGASLDDQSASPSRGAPRNGCSFEDDLSLGAEANHLQSGNKKTGSCFGLAADQKRSQYKEKGRSMNSTGSGKSSTVSSDSEVLEKPEEHPEEVLLTLRVSELLDLYEEDPEEVLLNLGFGRDEPDLSSKIPSRFFNSSSLARGIDIKVYLGAQLQRMEVENPNYALTSRFRQIEVLTTVANEFFQLYSQVSGQPVQRISSKEREDGKEESPPLKKRSSSALNAAKLLKKTISKHNLHALAAEATAAATQAPPQHAQLNGHADHTPASGHAPAAPERGAGAADLDHAVEAVNQKHVRKKDSFALATVAEETSGDGETDRLTEDGSPEANSTGAAANDERQSESGDHPSTNQGAEDQTSAEEGAKKLTSTPEKAPPTLAPPQLAQLRTENADSFDMEEIRSNEDEGLPPRTPRNTEMSRTGSQQSDSSGFAEEPSVDCSHLKVQASSDSCDSETTVTSHPSQDVATPLAMDQPVFNLPDKREEGAELGGAAQADGRSSFKEEDGSVGSSEKVAQYSAHQIPWNRPEVANQDENQDEGGAEPGERTHFEPDPQPEAEHTPSMSAAEQEPEHNQNQAEVTADAQTPTQDVSPVAQVEQVLDSSLAPAPSSPVLCALYRAKQMNRDGQRAPLQPSEMHPLPSSGRGRGGASLQRSSSLPSSLLSPPRVVSSVRIQFGRGQAGCTQPRYSFKYSQEAGENGEEEGGQTRCLSTLIINSRPPRPPTEASDPPKPIPRYLMQSSHSLHSPSPPPDWSAGGHAQAWSTQSVPDLSSNDQQLGQFPGVMIPNENQQNLNPGQLAFPYPHPATQYLSPSPSPHLNPSPFPFTQHYPTYLPPYTSLPNLHHHNPSLSHHSSLTSLYHPTTSTLPQHTSLSNLHQPPTLTDPHQTSLGTSHPGAGAMHHQGYNHPYQQSMYHSSPHGSHFSSPYVGYHGYSMNPHLAFPQPVVAQFQPSTPEHNIARGHVPPAPGFLPGPASGLGQVQNLHPWLTSPAAPSPGLSHAMSSTEVQLRRVLHDIRGTVQSLSQNRADTPDGFSEHQAVPSGHQSLIEFQQRRRSLNLFRSQMMDLELSIIRQQAQVYKHLSPADRLEVEQLQTLRSAVREELQELEQQLEERLLELTRHTPRKGLRRDNSTDSLSTASALRAMDPMSDLLREQLLLQSELNYDDHAPSSAPSSRSSSPVRGGSGKHGPGVYRACINITPAPPPRPNTHTEEEAVPEEEEEGGASGGGGGVGPESLQQLIREIRESVAQEVRREIYSELMAAVSPRRSPLPAGRHPL